MSLFWLVLKSFLEVLAVGALLGAGLPALFALGMRLLAWSEGAHGGEVHPAGRVGAYAIFALTVAIVLLGIAVIVASGFGVDLPF